MSEIPYPTLQHAFFQRQSITLPTREKYLQYYLNHPKGLRFFDRIVMGLLRPFQSKWLYPYKWGLFRVLMYFFYGHFKIWNRFTISGKNNVPDRGIFLVNHPGSLDPVLLETALRKPIGCFIGFEKMHFTWFLEQEIGFINRKGSRDYLIERMIRHILKINSYFAIWPEGTLSNDGKVMQGFSSIVRAYAALNSHRDVIPFIPTLIQGSECYNYQFLPRTQPIHIHFYKPIFIPRTWITEGHFGSKSPRQIIDFLMENLAKKNHQDTFVTNHRLAHRRKRWARDNK